MRALIGRLLIGAALFAAAGVSSREAGRFAERAEAHERLATLRDDVGDTNVPLDRATADYWQRRYDRLASAAETLDRDPDPEVLLLAANAAFRVSQQARPPALSERQRVEGRGAQAQQLDLVLQAYATALKSGVFVPDAAYNYEYVARLRDSLAKPPRFTGNRAAAAPEVPSVDLPIGPTIHGHPGGPPPDTKGEQFEIITPMEFGDREAQPEPNAGGRPLRKG